MPLNYDLREINQYKRLFRKAENGNSQMKSIPQTIILATMHVGMREITEENYEKFYTRLHLLETVHGTFFWERKRGRMIPKYITKDEVKRMIGLKVNVSNLTAGQFLKRFDKNQI